MTAFPRLAMLFGTPIDTLDAAAIERAVADQVAFTIGTDLLAEHAIDEPRILTPDGQAITTYFDSTFGHDDWARDWARENLNT